MWGVGHGEGRLIFGKDHGSSLTGPSSDSCSLVSASDDLLRAKPCGAVCCRRGAGGHHTTTRVSGTRRWAPGRAVWAFAATSPTRHSRTNWGEIGGTPHGAAAEVIALTSIHSES